MTNCGAKAAPKKRYRLPRIPLQAHHAEAGMIQYPDKSFATLRELAKESTNDESERDAIESALFRVFWKLEEGEVDWRASREGTWALMGDDVDSANLDAIVAHVCKNWSVDTSKILLTGMSDGGTFSYVSGLRSGTPFTHIAPIAASFHPMLLESAARERVIDLPVYLTHGALDWMFPVDIARVARDALTAAGAAVEYRELEDLSHTYPREENDRILDGLLGS